MIDVLNIFPILFLHYSFKRLSARIPLIGVGMEIQCGDECLHWNRRYNWIEMFWNKIIYFTNFNYLFIFPIIFLSHIYHITKNVTVIISNKSSKQTPIQTNSDNTKSLRVKLILMQKFKDQIGKFLTEEFAITITWKTSVTFFLCEPMLE